MTPETSALREITVSAPGKAILFGEHAAVYGRPALVAALGLRVRVHARVIDGTAVHLDLPGLEYRREHAWAEILEYTEAKRRRWQEYAAAPSPDAFRRMKLETPAHAALVALGEGAAGLEAPPPGLAVRVESEIPIGSGFGSSAAVAVGLVGAVLKLGGCPLLGADLLHEVRRLSLEVERRQHGTPSGIDNATVIHGGVVLAERPGEDGEDGELMLSSMPTPPEILGNFRLFQTGIPAESTGEVVAAVRALREREPQRVAAALDEIEAATRAFAVELARAYPRRAEAIPLMGQCQRALEALGVVPPTVHGLVRQVEALGGAAKISGAGALSGPAAGSLLVYHPQPEVIADWDCLRLLTPIDAPLGAEGVRREP